MSIENGKFEVGDRVKAFGRNGIVRSLEENGILVNFGGTFYFFFQDGRASDWHKTPSLKHRRFKKKTPTPKGKRGGREVWVKFYENDAKKPWAISENKFQDSFRFLEAEDQS